MKAAEKDASMDAFLKRETDILVSTTVVEVGVDVPNSTTILIENAEKFGLSQLHQLRGRVGRGEHESICILVCENGSEQALERLNVLKKSNDGFYIAKEDMRLRGVGDLIGVRQHGLPKLKIASLQSDERVVYDAKEAAVELLEKDPELNLRENKFLSKKVNEMLENVVNN
jgi:ATP-dependent DNA helicase RecG